MFGKKSSVIFCASLVFLVISIILATWGIPKIVKRQIQNNVQIENSSKMFERWRVLPMPLTFKVHLFNVTNTDDVNHGYKPKVKEVGPYVYKEYREKLILGYGENDTIKYMLKKRYIFDQEASGGLKEDDLVTVIHYPYMASMLTVLEMSPAFASVINNALNTLFGGVSQPFLTITVKELLFDGVYLNCTGGQQSLGLVCGKIKSEKPATMRPAEDGTGYYFSMFNHLNSTETGPYEMVRGTENLYDLGHIVSYRNKSVIETWGNPYCGQLNGTDSTIFAPVDGSNAPEKLYTFEPDLCRSLYASLVGERTLFNMSAYYYEISETVLASKSANPNNKCYCKKNWSAKHDGCLLMGVLNLLPCQGAHAIASLPHFYLASEELLEYIISGIEPDKEKHNTYLYLEPVTGVVLKGLKRLQFNIELRKVESVPQLAKVPTGLFPLLWIEEGAELPPSLQDELRDSHTMLGYVSVFRWTLLALAIVGAVAGAVILARAKSLLIWPQNNSVNFVLQPGMQSNSNKIY